MITRDDIQENRLISLAGNLRVVTFYYQPTTPLNKSLPQRIDPSQGPGSQCAARRGGNTAKWLRSLRSGSHQAMAEGLRGDGGKAKGNFACNKQVSGASLTSPHTVAQDQSFRKPPHCI